MAVYQYKALDLNASTLAGTVIADTARQARDVLRDQGLAVSEIRPVEEAKRKRLRRRGRDRQEVAAFTRRLATLLRAGITLMSALETLAEQHHRRFKPVIQDLIDQVAAGVSLAEAMRRRPEWFDDLCVSIVEVGENTGSLETALRRLAEYQEKAVRLRGRLTTALLYPAIVSVVGLCVTVFLMTYVVPNLLNTLRQAGKDLPLITRIVKGVSDLLVGYWWAILVGLAGLVALVRSVLAGARGKRVADRLVLRIPLIGDLIRKENTSRIAVVLATLLRSGLPFVEAVSITRRTIRSSVFRDAMERYQEAVTAGSDVSGPLKTSGVFSPMVVQMLAVGQQSGELEELLEQLSETYDQEVATATHRLTVVLEPALIVCLAVMLGFIILATILPILEASNVL